MDEIFIPTIADEIPSKAIRELPNSTVEIKEEFETPTESCDEIDISNQGLETKTDMDQNTNDPLTGDFF